VNVALKSSAPSDLEQIFEPIRGALEAVEEAYVRYVRPAVEADAAALEAAAGPRAVHVVDEVIPRMARYIQASGGKRVRPALLLLAARLAGYTGERAVVYASAVEFIHTATLVHDDIIDESELRRGRLAAHSRWGNDKTVLLGDYLYISSMKLALTYDDAIPVVRLLCDVTRRMIEGELYQLTKTGDVDISEDEYFEIIRRKTAYLFGGSAEIGSMLGTSTDAQRAALRDYGFNLGVAFQLVDDLLDFTADQAALGKPVGQDLREGKVTLAAIHLLQQDGASGPAHAIVRSAVDNETIDMAAWRELTALLREHRSTEYAYAKAVEHAAAARKCLDLFPPSEERSALLALPDYVLGRDR
jgi:octaprenyl-diphosphate synthase